MSGTWVVSIAAITMRAENLSPLTIVCAFGMTKALSELTRISFTSIFDTSRCSTSPSAYLTSLCSLVSSVTAPAVGMSSNMYSCQFLPMVTAFLGISVVRLLLIICFCSGSSTISSILERKELMALKSSPPRPRPGASITWLAASRLSLAMILCTSASSPSASRAMAILSSSARL